MEATVKHVYLYDDRTNAIVKDFCSGRNSFGDFDAVWEMVRLLNVDGCSRVEAIKYVGGEFGHQGYGRELYLKTKKGWMRRIDHADVFG